MNGTKRLKIELAGKVYILLECKIDRTKLMTHISYLLQEFLNKSILNENFNPLKHYLIS